jgi:phosphotransferase system HPr-like phosphotransfer protein
MPGPPPNWPNWLEKPKAMYGLRNAGSLLDILTLNCPEGTEITITIDDEADRNILTRIEALIRSGFGE